MMTSNARTAVFVKQIRRHLAAGVLLAMPLAVSAQAVSTTRATNGAAAARPGMVVVAGVVPDESARQTILARVRSVYGADRVVDQLGVGNLMAPPSWAENVQRMLTAELKQVRHGQIAIQGNLVEVRGEVASEAVRQQLVSTLSTQINNPTYTIRNGLHVAGAGQEQLDSALANRTIEFEPGSSELTSSGQLTLDQLVPVLSRLSGRKFEVIGHTDGLGARSTNVALSAARAERVKSYLVAKGMPESVFSTSGVGPDRPVAANDSPDGRARNRRIEFRVGQ